MARVRSGSKRHLMDDVLQSEGSACGDSLAAPKRRRTCEQPSSDLDEQMQEGVVTQPQVQGFATPPMPSVGSIAWSGSPLPAALPNSGSFQSLAKTGSGSTSYSSATTPFQAAPGWSSPTDTQQQQLQQQQQQLGGANSMYLNHSTNASSASSDQSMTTMQGTAVSAPFPAMQRSSSAPDLHMVLNGQLLKPLPQFWHQPVPPYASSTAGALTPYKGPEGGMLF